MTDPFRSLDQVDPPDQWDDIVDRAGHDTDAVRVDDEPRRPVLRQARTWIAAAAAVALVGGGIALASNGDADDGVRVDPAATTTDPAAEGGVTIDGPCPFTVRPGELVPEMQPGRQPVEPELGILPGPTEPTFAHGLVDDLLVEVAVGTGVTTATAADGLRSVIDGDVGWVESYVGSSVSTGGPCDEVVVGVRMPMRPDDLQSGGEDLAFEPYVDRAEPVLAAVLASIAFADPTTGDAPAGEPVTIDGPCPFTVDQDELGFSLNPGRNPVEPELGILPGPTAPSFAHGQVDGALVEVAVGTGVTTASPPEGTRLRSGIEGGSGWVEVAMVDATRSDGPCAETVVAVVVRVPMLPEDVASGASDLAFRTYFDLSSPIGTGILAAIEFDADGSPDDSTPPRIEGTLANGSPFEVWEDPGHGLCASLGDVDLGCDDVGPVISPDADPSTPRLGIDECCTPLWFGFLPEGAVDVVLDTATGERLDVDAVVGDGIWALPVPAEHAEDSFDGTTTTVVYVLQGGTEVPAPHVG